MVSTTSNGVPHESLLQSLLSHLPKTARAIPSASQRKGANSMKTILIVEDDPIFAEEIKSLVSSNENLSVVGTTESGRQAIIQIREIRPDIVLLDIVLPDITGLSVLRECRRRNLSTEFLVVSSFEDNAKIFEAIVSGANGYITKDRLHIELMPAVEDLLRGGSPMSSAVARKALESFRNKVRPKTDLSDLSPREEDIMRAFALGKSYKEISDEMFIAPETVKTHIRNVYKKLQVNSRTGLRKLL
ncbi:MAG: response regulator transcription factor [Candidatus Kapabacteria bacterium]|nr:response regulator transcription factor [Candidatus Kapabacteria bacterium]